MVVYYIITGVLYTTQAVLGGLHLLTILVHANPACGLRGRRRTSYRGGAVHMPNTKTTSLPRHPVELSVPLLFRSLLANPGVFALPRLSMFPSVYVC